MHLSNIPASSTIRGRQENKLGAVSKCAVLHIYIYVHVGCSCRLACLKLHEESTLRLKEAANLEKEQLVRKHNSEIDQLRLAPHMPYSK